MMIPIGRIAEILIEKIDNEIIICDQRYQNSYRYKSFSLTLNRCKAY